MSNETAIAMMVVTCLVLFGWVLVVLGGIVIDALLQCRKADKYTFYTFYTFDNTSGKVDEIIEDD
jgi:hypothetical protein